VLELLEEEVKECLGLLGLVSFDGPDNTYLHQAQPTTEAQVHSAFPLLDQDGY